ncbi:tautomerase family protein [Ornithinimicrobium sufpigmenti]|uniref:tautomerase family protein n=1 Tax=Ornithinimicrobium sufpigmenti TaxID=2508882 RepID=UPI0015E172C0|nr:MULTISPECIES: tautomerase family protein [unclassified Ornithinimicrobium]
MAIVRVEMGKRPQPERESIIAGITDVLVAHGSPRENTHVILYEIDYDVWAKGGLPYSVRAKTVPQPSGTHPGSAGEVAGQHEASDS